MCGAHPLLDDVQLQRSRMSGLAFLVDVIFDVGKSAQDPQVALPMKPSDLDGLHSTMVWPMPYP